MPETTVIHKTDGDYLADILDILTDIRDILTDMRDDHSTIDVRVIEPRM